MSFSFDINRTKYSANDFDDFINLCLKFLFIYSWTFQSWSLLILYNSFHVNVFSDKNVISWSQSSYFNKYVSDWFMISYTLLMKHNLWFIQLIWELTFWSQDSFSIIVYLHSSSTSKTIIYCSSYIIVSTSVSIQINSCQLCVLLIWIIWNDFCDYVWIFRLLITYWCRKFLFTLKSIKTLNDFFFTLMSVHNLWMTLFSWDIISFFFSSFVEKADCFLTLEITQTSFSFVIVSYILCFLSLTIFLNIS